MFHTVVVANRGAVAARVIRCLRTLGLRAVAVYSAADAQVPYLEQADEVYALGPAPSQQSYLNQDALLHVIRSSGADGLHPGYGFLAESAAFAAAVERLGCRFIIDPTAFLPSPGLLTVFRPPMEDGIRIETGYREGSVITPYYDPLIAKVIAAAPTRDQAILRLREAVRAFTIQGVKTNQPFIERVLQHEALRQGDIHTGLAAQIVGGKPHA